MSYIHLPIERESDSDKFFVTDGTKKYLYTGIPILLKQDNRYEDIGTELTMNLKDNWKPNTYFVRSQDTRHSAGPYIEGGGNKTKRRQYRYRASSKKRIASRRRNRGRGRQTIYSRRK